MTPDAVTVAPDVAAIVRPAWAVVEGVRVVDREARLDDPLRGAAAAMRGAPEAADVTAAVRTMYKRVGIDPTKTRPSSEALLRRVRKGDELPRINSLVDIINWCSLESQLPFGLYDADRIEGAVTLRLGQPGEAYPGIRKDEVHVAGRLTLADARGPFGNPTSDSARTMTTTATTRALVVIFAPAPVSAAVAERALRMTVERIDTYCRS
ncbi:MAG: B3/4 domain-containing protein [Vicinamibacterales bacterium]